VDAFLGHGVNPFVANPPQNGSLARAESSTPDIDVPVALLLGVRLPDL
jgi:hypothetical protein